MPFDVFIMWLCMALKSPENWGINPAEKTFIEYVRKSGLRALPPQPIRCQTPVLDKNGLPIKVVTTPDCLVAHLIAPRSISVEVTQGRGKWESKAAQRRVIDQARLEQEQPIPYCVVTGHELAELQEQPSWIAVYNYLLFFFGWDDLVE